MAKWKIYFARCNCYFLVMSLTCTTSQSASDSGTPSGHLLQAASFRSVNNTTLCHFRRSPLGNQHSFPIATTGSTCPLPAAAKPATYSRTTTALRSLLFHFVRRSRFSFSWLRRSTLPPKSGNKVSLRQSSIKKDVPNQCSSNNVSFKNK